MNVLLFSKEARSGHCVRITEQKKIDHLIKILKLKTNDSIKLGEINGKLGTGTIIKLDACELSLKVNLEQAPPDALPCSVILALPRPQQLKRILVHLSALGVKDIHLIQSARVEKNYWQSPTLEAIHHYLIEGLEQAKDTVLPTVSLHKNYTDFINKDIHKILEHKQAWLAQPGAQQSIQRQSDASSQHVIVVGPEGGFIPEEVEHFKQLGCQTVSLGQRILKTETAIPVMLAALLKFP